MTKQQLVSMFKNNLGVTSGYYPNFMENTLSMVQESDFVDDFKRGSGHELSPKSGKPKFCSIVSSAALVVNAFAPWKRYREILSIDLGKAVIRGFLEFNFEEKVLNGLNGAPPHLDVWLSNDHAIIGIESKFTELFDKKKKEFSDQYRMYIRSNQEEFLGSPWIDFIDQENLIGSYKHLDVAQLVKHYFGLKHYKKTHNPKKTIYLLYLYWYPNGHDLQDDLVYKEHDEELGRFASYVEKDRDIIFKHMTYNQLYQSWCMSAYDDNVRAHLLEFERRYMLL